VTSTERHGQRSAPSFFFLFLGRDRREFFDVTAEGTRVDGQNKPPPRSIPDGGRVLGRRSGPKCVAVEGGLGDRRKSPRQPGARCWSSGQARCRRRSERLILRDSLVGVDAVNYFLTTDATESA